MRVEAPLVTHTIEHLSFRFVSGLPLDVDVDYEAGDSVDWGEESGQIDITIVDRVSPMDGESKVAGRHFSVRTDQLAYIERSTRQVVDLTPEQQREQRVMVKNLVEQVNKAKGN